MPQSPTPTARPAVRSSHWPVAGLLLLGALPLTFGALRMLQFVGVVEVLPPVPGGLWVAAPIAIHIGAAAVYAVLGAFQFSASLRKRWPSWHRSAGRVSLGSGLLVALSALWLTASYAMPTPGGVLLASFRIAFACGLLVSLWLGLAAARRRSFQRHSEWMTRAYAIALGASTQMIVLTIAELATGGPPGELGRALLMALAWTINLMIAEWLVQRRRQASPVARGGTAVTAATGSR